MSQATITQAVEMSVEAAPARKTRARRQPVKAIAKTPDEVAANAKADRQRKAASKKALKAEEARLAAIVAEDAARIEAEKRAQEVALYAAAENARAEEYRQNALKTAAIDADATGQDVAVILAAMGLDEEGRPLDLPKTGYTGPMLALRRAVVNYVKAENGRPCCGDELATLCGRYSRETVVVGLIRAMGLPGNPYAHLNPGQQSMNLRNKARAALKNGLLEIAKVEAALVAANEVSKG